MKKLTLFCLISILAFSSCKKEESCPYTDSGLSASTTERAYLTSYLASNSIAATEHSSGVFYSDVTAGSGATPEICSVINVKYRGTLIPSGAQFDATVGSSSATFPLGKLIVGWQKALPVIKTGGKITLYIPPSLGYGSQNVRDPQTGAIVIPGDSYLKFEIELMDVQ